MEKKPRLFYKMLVFGVIVLFIGIGIQPAFAVTPDKSDNDDDCKLCPKVSNLHFVRLKNLLNRVEKYDNILSVLSKHNSKEINKELKPNKPLNDYPITCNILDKILNRHINRTIWFENLCYKFKNIPILYNILVSFFHIYFFIGGIIVIIGYGYGCWDIIPPYITLNRGRI